MKYFENANKKLVPIWSDECSWNTHVVLLTESTRITTFLELYVIYFSGAFDIFSPTSLRLLLAVPPTSTWALRPRAPRKRFDIDWKYLKHRILQ